MLLAFEPAIYDLENHTVSPLTLPGYNWRLSQVQNFTCRFGHEHIDPPCGCGIQTTLNLHDVVRLWQSATDPIYPVGILLVQVLGDTYLDEATWNVRSDRIFLYGAVCPKWMEPEEWVDWWEVLKGEYAPLGWPHIPKPWLLTLPWHAEGRIVSSILKTMDEAGYTPDQDDILRRYVKYAKAATTELARAEWM